MKSQTEDWEDGNVESDDFADDEDESTIPCPYCGHEMFEDSPQCPYCQQYISEEDAPPIRKSWWIIAGVLLCMAAVLLWII